jgi:PAS domain S-box-containing protein
MKKANMNDNKTIKILHVDDDICQLNFTKRFLEELDDDFIVESVSTPEEAIQLAYNNHYDIVISDYNMANMTGIQLAQKIKDKINSPFILYTWHNSDEVAESAFKAGIDDYIKKEFDHSHYQVLSKRIRHSVDKYRAEELFHKVVKESRDGIIILINNKVVFANKATCILYGFNRPEHFLGKEVSDLVIESDGAVKSNPSPYLQVNDSEGIFDVIIKTRAGDIKFVEISSSKIIYQNKSAYLYFLRDITQRKHLRTRRFRSSYRVKKPE